MSNPEDPEVGRKGAVEKRRRWTEQQRRQIVEATIGTGVSVARVARAHGVNANQVYTWRRRLERESIARQSSQSAMIPVRVIDADPGDRATVKVHRPVPGASAGAMYVEFAKARLHVEGAPEPATLRLVLECLLR